MESVTPVVESKFQRQQDFKTSSPIKRGQTWNEYPRVVGHVGFGFAAGDVAELDLNGCAVGFRQLQAMRHRASNVLSGQLAIQIEENQVIIHTGH